jgi:hypothetical protein
LTSANVRLFRQLRTEWGDRGTVLIDHAFGWHEDPAVIAWWRTRCGGILRWLTPRRRRFILAAASVVIGVPALLRLASPTGGVPLPLPTDQVGQALTVVAVFAFLGLCFIAAANFKSLPDVVRRHPQMTLHAVFWGLLLALWNTAEYATSPWREVATAIVVILTTLLWRLGYLLLSAQRGKVAGTRFTDHLIYLLPLYPGLLALGKGLDYLGRHEARDEDALARAQLAGAKLLGLAASWKVVLSVMNGFVYGSANSKVSEALGGLTLTLLPRFGELLAQGSDASTWESWVSIYLELVRQVLVAGVYGHVIVGVLRIFGFNIFRATYKPLLSETVVQFWGRFDYYFKEVLVDFFFLPTFAKGFRKRPALRMFTAVFAAAVVGNMYLHIIQFGIFGGGALVLADFDAIWSAFDSRLFYCVLLALGIFISMRREQQRAGVAPAAGVTSRVARLAGVWTFFAVIRIWDEHPEVSFLTRTQFFFGLFGLA